jgi:hypothetical protein
MDLFLQLLFLVTTTSTYPLPFSLYNFHSLYQHYSYGSFTTSISTYTFHIQYSKPQVPCLELPSDPPRPFITPLCRYHPLATLPIFYVSPQNSFQSLYLHFPHHSLPCQQLLYTQLHFLFFAQFHTVLLN